MVNAPEAQTYRFLNDIYRPCVAKHRDIQNLKGILRDLENGTAVLDNAAKCEQYIALYGAYHFHKLYKAFVSANFEAVEGRNIEIMDWGCGQALATCVLLDYFIEQRLNPNIVSVTLIEPSSIALERGYTFIRQMLRGNNFAINPALRLVNKSIDDLSSHDLVASIDTIKVHLFSNIIDVEAFNLEKLHALIIDSFRTRNRIICTSPKNNRISRLDNFYTLFEQSCLIYRPIRSDEDIDAEVFHFKAGKDKRCGITRYERQFTIKLA